MTLTPDYCAIGCAECGEHFTGPEADARAALAEHVRTKHFGTKWRRDGEDMSKGIAPLSERDNSVAFLPEDLLADDAP